MPDKKIIAGHEDMSLKILEQERTKEKKLNDNIEKYSLAREKMALEREQREKKKAAEDVLERKRTLQIQVEERVRQQQQEQDEEAKYAQLYRKESEQTKAEELSKKQKWRDQQRKHQQALVDQMNSKTKLQGDRHVDHEAMSSAEKMLNSQMLSGIQQDSGTYQKLQMELSRRSQSSYTPAGTEKYF